MRIILSIIFVILVLGAGFYVWQHRYDYFFKGILNTNDAENSILPSPEASSAVSPSVFPSISSRAEITEDDCQRECRTKQGTEDYDYCREVCGFNGTKVEVDINNCDNYQDLEKDSCFKKKAIETKDESFCNNISDGNLQKSCKNRIVEELIP